MPTFNHNGTEIAFFDSGGDGPTVVLSHGFLMDHTMFDPQVEALSPEFRVVTWDERGFGLTPSPGPFSFWDAASDVVALLDHLGVEKAIVGGMSQGGFISLRVALQSPERVVGLVLIDTQSGTEDPAQLEGYNSLRDAWMEHGPAPVQDVVASLILGPGEWRSWFDKWEVLDRKQFSLAYDCLVGRDDVTARLGEIACPALVVHGTEDGAIPFDKAEQLRDRLAGFTELVAVEGAPHAANLTHPEIVNAAILRFARAAFAKG
jgi:3-oxoadipate enol-lactonase